jgi:hypothetical protein
LAVCIKDSHVIGGITASSFFQVLRSVIESVSIFIYQDGSVVLTVVVGTFVAIAGMLATIPIVLRNVNIGGGGGTTTFS